eukprot:1338459-Amphidinium_carterae.1
MTHHQASYALRSGARAISESPQELHATLCFPHGSFVLQIASILMQHNLALYQHFPWVLQSAQFHECSLHSVHKFTVKIEVPYPMPEATWSSYALSFFKLNGRVNLFSMECGLG